MQPDRAAPKTKTLYEIAAERQAELSQGQPFARSNDGLPGPDSEPELVTKMLRPDGTLAQLTDGAPDSELLGPLAQALFNALTLTILHFTLEVLAHHQYRTEVGWAAVVRKTLLAFPVLLLLIYAVHRRGAAGATWMQALFCAGSAIAGCYLVRTSHHAAYYAVMKRAPPLGTLWVWMVMEMRSPVALLSLAAVGVYFWWGQYTMLN